MIEADVEQDAVADDANDRTAGTPTWARALVFGAAAVALLLVGATIGLLIGRSEFAADDTADTRPNRVDIGFCQDMSVHHRQAVEMGDIARIRGFSGNVKLLGFDISSTQNGQTGRMQGWLTLWDAPSQAPGDLMTWMSDDHDSHGMPASPKADDGVPMPGMATRADMRKLGKLSGQAFDVYFLQLMLRHHQGGSAMAEYTAKHAAIPAVRALAQSMVDSQGSEMLTMRDMLKHRGAKPLPLN